MAIPDYQTIMGPLLNVMADGKEYKRGELVAKLSKYFNLSEEEKNRPKPSGGESLFKNRVGWANFYLKKAGLAESKNYGFSNITSEGLKVSKNEEIDKKFLMNYPSFRDFILGEGSDNGKSPKTPEEEMDYYYGKITQELTDEILNLIKSNSPWFFEKLVLDLLQKMGYGGFPESGEGTPRSRDGGIDGIIKEDKLGLERIHIQAKKYTDNVVSRGEVQKFVGAIRGKGEKGIFITTSSFSKPGIQFVNEIPTKIVLIDGELLARLMIEHDIGLSEIKSYKIRKIDTDYFNEE